MADKTFKDVVQEFSGVTKETKKLVQEQRQQQKLQSQTSAEIASVIKGDLAKSMDNLKDSLLGPVKSFAAAIPGMTTLGKIGGILMKGASEKVSAGGKSSAASKETEDKRDQERIDKQQISFLAQIASGMMDMKKGLLDALKGLKEKGKFGLGVIAGLVAAPVIALVEFFRQLKTELSFLQALTKTGGFSKTFGAIKNFFSWWTNTFFGPVVRLFNTVKNSAAMGKVAATVGGVITRIKTFFMAVGKFFQPVVKAIKGIFGFLSKSGSFMSGFSAVSRFAKIFGQVMGKVFLPITIITSIWDFFKGFSSTEGSFLKKLGGGLGGLVKGLIGLPLDLLKGAISWVFGAFGFDGVEKWLDSFSIGDMLEKFVKKAFAILTYPITLVSNLFSNVFGAIGSVFGGLWNIVKGIFTLDLGMIGDGIFGTLGGIWDFVTAPFRSIFQTVADIFDFDWMGILKSIPGVGWLLGKMGFGEDENKKLEQNVRNSRRELIQAEKRARLTERAAAQGNIQINGQQATPEQMQALVNQRRAEVDVAALNLHDAQAALDNRPTTFMEDISSFGSGMMESLGNMLPSMEDIKAALPTMESITQNFTALKDRVVNALPALPSLDDIKAKLPSWDSITSKVSSLKDMIVNNIPAFPSIEDITSKLPSWDSITSKVSSVKDMIVNNIPALPSVEDIVSKLPSWDSITSKVSSVKDMIVNNMPELPTLEDITSKLPSWDTITGGLKTLKDNITSLMPTVPTLEELTAMLPDPLKGMIDSAKQMVDNVTNAISDILPSWDDITASLPSLGDVKNKVLSFFGWGDDDGENVDGRAAGGPVSAGRTYLVGERGPELFVPGVDGQVVNSVKTMRILEAQQEASAITRETARAASAPIVVNAPNNTTVSGGSGTKVKMMPVHITDQDIRTRMMVANSF